MITNNLIFISAFALTAFIKTFSVHPNQNLKSFSAAMKSNKFIL